MSTPPAAGASRPPPPSGAPSAGAAAPRLPRTFGRYALFDFIGKGGMAEIYLARQKTELGPARRCVVKQILPELASDPTFSEMLVHEAKLAARLSHANVVQVFDLGREGARLFIAMEYVEGFDLNALLRRCSQAKVPFPFELGVHVVREALRGLDYAHRRTDDAGRPLGIVHRDVSPSNLLVSFEGEIKVCDFGIARANDVLAATATTAAHELGEALKGKAGYMSPEHARGEPIDARADVFAAGIVLWELTSGRRMYRAGEGRDSLLDQARRADVPELPRLGRPAEHLLRPIVAKALAPSKSDRYASAAAMLRDLDDYAMDAKLMASPLQLGEWLKETFGEEILARRRMRERATEALEHGAPLVLQAIATSASKAPSVPPPKMPSKAPPPVPSRASAAPAPTAAPALTAAPAPLTLPIVPAAPVIASVHPAPSIDPPGAAGALRGQRNKVIGIGLAVAAVLAALLGAFAAHR